MSCFENIIGIQTACNVTNGTSGLNIEDIGITCDEAGMYINAEYSNGETFIKDKLAFASKTIAGLIQNHFSKHINTRSLISSQTLGYFQDSLKIKDGIADNLGGINFRLNAPNTYFSVFVSSISLQINQTQNVDVLVIDLNSGETLDTITISAEANKVITKTINKTYYSNRQKLDLIFVYDTTDITSNTTNIWNSGCLSCTGYSYSNSFIWSAPVYVNKNSVKVRSNIYNGNHTFGLSINYSLQCAVENWLCEIANLMALPILYKTGEEIMNYAIYYSNRQNSDVNIDAERNKERLEFYKQKYSESLQATIEKINLPSGDICFKCEDFIKSAIILP